MAGLDYQRLMRLDPSPCQHRGPGQNSARAHFGRTLGPTPAGYHRHHVCRDRRCHNPLHLVTVTKAFHGLLHSGPGGK